MVRQLPSNKNKEGPKQRRGCHPFTRKQRHWWNSAILDSENLGEHLCIEQLSCCSTQQRQIVGETRGLFSIWSSADSVCQPHFIIAYEAVARTKKAAEFSVQFVTKTILLASLYQSHTKDFLGQRKQQSSASNLPRKRFSNLTLSIACEAVAGAKKVADFSVQVVTKIVFLTSLYQSHTKQLLAQRKQQSSAFSSEQKRW